jgi:GxxExxY protein
MCTTYSSSDLASPQLCDFAFKSALSHGDLGDFALNKQYCGNNIMHENEISRFVVDSAIEVHRTLGGPGLIESVYEEAMAWELSSRGLKVEQQKHVPISYKGNFLSTPLRLDILVEDLVVIEAKALTKYNQIFEAQALTYLRLLNLKLAMVINFGERRVVDGIHRVVNGL